MCQQDVFAISYDAQDARKNPIGDLRCHCQTPGGQDQAERFVVPVVTCPKHRRMPLSMERVRGPAGRRAGRPAGRQAYRLCRPCNKEHNTAVVPYPGHNGASAAQL